MQRFREQARIRLYRQHIYQEKYWCYCFFDPAAVYKGKKHIIFPLSAPPLPPPPPSSSSGVSIRLDGDVAMEAGESGGGGRRRNRNGGNSNSNSSSAGSSSNSGPSLLSVPAPGGVFPLPNSQQVASSSSSNSLSVGSATGEDINYRRNFFFDLRSIGPSRLFWSFSAYDSWTRSFRIRSL